MGDTPVKPTYFRNFIDASMNNLDINTIWFEDGTYLNTAKGLVGTAGGLSFQYSVNINDATSPTDTIDGKIRFNSSSIADSVSLFISTKTIVLNKLNLKKNIIFFYKENKIPRDKNGKIIYKI